MVRYYMVVEGRVQGVGFRYFCQMNALKHSITGWARNLENGMVELEIQGSEASISKFILLVKEGNRFIRVDDYSTKKISLSENENNFKIKY